ncbi:MAG: MFS transporter [Pseudonocardia sp. SCN 72-51]|nr:MAG: MFS transporter [Pseudonocardia sp. SCN 72-51]
MAVAFLAELVPVYALYAVWFVATGLSEAQVSALFAIWSVVGLIAEVPSGALADRFGRRRAVVTAHVGQAAGYAVWALWPTFTGFAAGFALWALGGSLESGAKEALLYDALAPGEQWRYARIASGSSAAGLLAQVPAAGLATLLLATGGGFAPVAWLSVGTCLVTAALAARLPDVRPGPSVLGDDEGDRGDELDDESALGWYAALRAGVVEAAAHPPVRAILLAVAVLGGVDALEEYFPLMAADWSVPNELVPPAVVATAVTGAVGAALGGVAAGWGRWRLTATIAAAVVALAVAAALAVPLAMILVAVFYGGYRLVLVVLEVRLQVTSVSGFGVEIVGLAVFGAWAVGGIWPIVAAAALVTALLPRILRTP